MRLYAYCDVTNSENGSSVCIYLWPTSINNARDLFSLCLCEQQQQQHRSNMWSEVALKIYRFQLEFHYDAMRCDRTIVRRVRITIFHLSSASLRHRFFSICSVILHTQTNTHGERWWFARFIDLVLVFSYESIQCSNENEPLSSYCCGSQNERVAKAKNVNRILHYDFRLERPNDRFFRSTPHTKQSNNNTKTKAKTLFNKVLQ